MHYNCLFGHLLYVEIDGFSAENSSFFIQNQLDIIQPDRIIYTTPPNRDLFRRAGGGPILI